MWVTQHYSMEGAIFYEWIRKALKEESCLLEKWQVRFGCLLGWIMVIKILEESMKNLNVTLFGNRVFLDIMKLLWSHSGLQRAPMQKLISFQKGKFWQRHTGRIPCVDGGKYWSNSSIKQGTPMIPGNYQNLGRSKKASSLGVFPENMALSTHWFRVPGFKH